ncbi:hypothetical protein V8G54_022496, partial [Vigna mungo]
DVELTLWYQGGVMRSYFCRLADTEMPLCSIELSFLVVKLGDQALFTSGFVAKQCFLEVRSSVGHALWPFVGCALWQCLVRAPRRCRLQLDIFFNVSMLCFVGQVHHLQAEFFFYKLRSKAEVVSTDQAKGPSSSSSSQALRLSSSSVGRASRPRLMFTSRIAREDGEEVLANTSIVSSGVREGARRNPNYGVWSNVVMVSVVVVWRRPGGLIVTSNIGWFIGHVGCYLNMLLSVLDLHGVGKGKAKETKFQLLCFILLVLITMASFGSLKSTIFSKEERKQQYQWHIRGLNAYDRHKKFINDYEFLLRFSLFVTTVNFYGKERPSNLKLPIKTDQDTLREGYRFIRSEEDDMNPSWEQRLVKRYYDKLFKEYCLADMSQYKNGKFGLQEIWSVSIEPLAIFCISLLPESQFICGNKHCNEKDSLTSYEVNFCYFEAGENKQALVKLVTCERCACKLNYKRQKEKEQLEKRQQDQDRRKRNRSKSDDDLDDYQESNERKRKGLNLHYLYKFSHSHRFLSHPFFNILAKSYAPDLVAPANAPHSRLGPSLLWP